MRIRRSVTRIFGLSVLPAVSCAVIAYFGYYAVWGERGMLALSDVQAQLGVRKDRLAQAQDVRRRLEHRISLMGSPNADPDLIEELSRGRLMMAPPGAVAVPRSGH
ncbi:MAG TPA: septum formation initiator family protein [Rhizomicrobium sp.]